MPAAPTPQPSAGERLRLAGVAAWSIIGLLILAAITVWLLLKVRVILPPLVIALLVIYLLNPPITGLTTRGIQRGIATITVFLGALLLLFLLALAIVPFVSAQASTFAEEWPAFRREMFVFVQDTSHNIEDRFGIEINTSGVACLLGEADQIEGRDCSRVTADVRDAIVHQAGRLTSVGRSLLEILLVTILGPLIALYLLFDLPQIQRDLLNLVPEAHRREAADLGAKVARAVGGFFRGQLLVALAVGVLSAAGFKLIGLPFWLLIGAIAGFFNLVPLVGPFIGGGVGFLVGVVSGGLSLGVKAALVELVVQQLDNHIISPQVMRRTVELHPATVALSILAGGAVGGFWGVLLGVPTVAVGKILLGHLWATRVLGVEVTPYGREATAREALAEAEPEGETGSGADPAGPPDAVDAPDLAGNSPRS